METKSREKLLLIAVGACAVLWLLNLLVVSPLTNAWHSRSDEIVKLKKEIADGAILVRREAAVRDRWDNMRANALASNPTVAERQMFTAFDHWGSSGGGAEGSFRPQVTEGDTNFSTVECRSDVSGSLDKVRDFLRAMSKDPLANKVDSFEVTSRDDNGRQLVLGLSLSGLVLADSGPSQIPAPSSTAVPVQAASLAVNSDLDPFQIISRNNIFDQSRTYSGGRRPRPPAVVVDTISFSGTGIDNGVGSAFLEGTGVSSSRCYKVGDSIGDGFKIAKITPNTLTLAAANPTNTFVLSMDGNASLRREDNGPWHLSGYIAADPPPDANTQSTSATAASGPGGSNIEEILKKRREQEEK